jgi:hypothetical protein
MYFSFVMFCSFFSVVVVTMGAEEAVVAVGGTRASCWKNTET